MTPEWLTVVPRNYAAVSMYDTPDTCTNCAITATLHNCNVIFPEKWNQKPRDYILCQTMGIVCQKPVLTHATTVLTLIALVNSVTAHILNFSVLSYLP